MSQRYLLGGCSTAAALLMASALSGCGGSSMNSDSAPMPSVPANMNSTTPPAVAQAMDSGTAVDPAIVTADNAFALNLFQNLNTGASGNVSIAPISVAMTLQILYNGAAGATQQAMAQTLQLGAMSTQELNNANAALQGSLMNADPNVQLVIANSLWVHMNATTVLPSFTQMDEMYYGATVGDLAGAPANVNNWVSAETNGFDHRNPAGRQLRRGGRGPRERHLFQGAVEHCLRSQPDHERTLHPGRRHTGVGADDAPIRQLQLPGGNWISGVAVAVRAGPPEHAARAAGYRHQFEQPGGEPDPGWSQWLDWPDANRQRGYCAAPVHGNLRDIIAAGPHDARLGSYFLLGRAHAGFLRPGAGCLCVRRRAQNCRRSGREWDGRGGRHHR